MLANAALSLETRVGPTLDIWDRQFLSVIVGVFTGLARILGGSECNSLISKMKDDHHGSGAHQGESKRDYTGPSPVTRRKTSAKWSAVYWDKEQNKKQEEALHKNGPQRKEMREQIADLEKCLRITEKAAAAGLLSCGILHDVNHYLAVIRSAGELLQCELNGLARESEEDLEAIVTSAGKAGALIHKFQFLARPGTEQGVKVNLIDVLRSARTLMKRQLKKKNIELIMEAKPDLPPLIGDPAALEEVVINLLSNSTEALEAGGRIRMVLDSSSSNGSREIVMLVEDNGPGVPKEIRDCVFDSFVTGREDGTGLGLFLVKRIIERHGGNIKLFSSRGRGTRFLIRLPAQNV